ncbi:MAG: hypothetical protein ABFS21_07690 [Actinomycetota bacterium]
MDYLKSRVIASIQDDRMREAAAARLHAPPRVPGRFRRRLAASLHLTDVPNRQRTPVPRVAA